MQLRSQMTTAALVSALWLSSTALAYEGRRSNSVSLNGVWEFAQGSGEEGAEAPEGQRALSWRQVRLPGPFLEWSEEAARTIPVIWTRRSFSVTRQQAEALAVLRWNRIALGAEAFINGKQVADHEPTGPCQVIVPHGVLRAGENQIVLKVRGAAGVRKARCGFFLIPAGFASCHRRGMPEVTDDLWIDFADRVYAKWALGLPDLAGSRVRIRVTPAALDRVDAFTIEAQVRPWPNGEVIGHGRVHGRSSPSRDPLGGEHFFVDVPMPGFKPWTFEDPNLYLAELTLTDGTKVLDRLTFRFGMREISVSDGNYKLNGKNLWLRGSNLVFEWDWGDVITGKEKAYLVTEAREMSLNSFRTHTRPLPRLWADICDEHGTMILAEFPCLYNYRDYKFTAEEYAIWHRNVLTDAAGWMARLWNHPSVVMWVLSNESNRDRAWETGPYRDFVVKLDPTRPTLRTGDTGTRENYDVHTCGNTIRTDEGHLQLQIPGWFKQAGDRTLTNTEYMNIFSRPLCQWTGTDDREADSLAYAQLGMEHTEAMRRARLDGLWPYMYAGWTRTRRDGHVWKGGFAHPASACWHSALSPVLASLDLFDANYVAGKEVTTDLHLINDSWHRARIHVDLMVTEECPEFIPEAWCFRTPVAKWSFDFTLEADGIRIEPVSWKVPDAEGTYWLTARTTGASDRAVLSQRFLHAVKPPEVPARAKTCTFVLLGSDDSAREYFRARGLKTSDRVADLRPGRDAVIVWNPARLTAEEKQHVASLRQFVAAGGRVVVLSTRRWDWRELRDIRVVTGRAFSRVFPCEGEGERHALLEKIDPRFLTRWNGLPGTVAWAALEGPALAMAREILWARDRETVVTAEIPAGGGAGAILFTQLALRDHVGASSPRYDPVAERILYNILAWSGERER